MKKTITDNETGCRWEIVKHGEDDYTVNYYEYYQSCGWRQIDPYHDRNERYTRDAIEMIYGRAYA